MKTVRLAIVVFGCLSGMLPAQEGGPSVVPSKSWNSQAAAAYLDARISRWMDWPPAARDHDTFCVSCHTAAPYALARPALRGIAGEPTPSALERRLLDNVIRRVRMWKDVAPFYPSKSDGDPKTAESRGTESILNGLILVRYDEGSGKLSPDTKLALDAMWAEQLKTGAARGAWPWLEFHNSPWEGDSQYYGAALAAVAVGKTPAEYRGSPEIRDGLKLLSEYLVRGEASQVPINRVMLLWAAARLPRLLSGERQKALIGEVLAAQQADGSFCLCSLIGGWKRKDNTPLETRGDGYATGLIVLALEQAGVPDAQPQVSRARHWLAANQSADGNWPAWSLNKQRDPASEAGHFMSDAATAYAVLALTHSR